MRFILCFLLIGMIPLAASSSSYRIKVQKVKGRSALVQFIGKIEPGEEYILVARNQDPEGTRSGPRLRRLGMNFDFSSLKTTSGGIESSPNNFTFSFDYGWNSGNFEYGPILGYSSQNPGFGGTTTYLTIGGFFDYNFQENREPLAYLFGLGLKVTYANISTPADVPGLYQMIFYPQFFWKWFAFGQSTAIRWDAGYYLEQSKLGSSTEVKTSGLKSTAALLFYF